MPPPQHTPPVPPAGSVCSSCGHTEATRAARTRQPRGAKGKAFPPMGTPPLPGCRVAAAAHSYCSKGIFLLLGAFLCAQRQFLTGDARQGEQPPELTQHTQGSTRCLVKHQLPLMCMADLHITISQVHTDMIDFKSIV